MSYEVFILRRAQKQLAQLPSHDYERVKTSILAHYSHLHIKEALNKFIKRCWL